MSQSGTLHVAMYPWFAFGHLTPYLHLANKLAQRGHRVSLFMPPKAHSRLQHLNLYPHLINLIPLVIPHVDGLPQGAQTTNDIPIHMSPYLFIAMDLTEKDIEAYLCDLKPDVVLFDMPHWIPALATRFGIKTVYYNVGSSVFSAYFQVPAREQGGFNPMEQPLGFPASNVKMRWHECLSLASTYNNQSELGPKIDYKERYTIAYSECNAISFRTCREIGGPFCDYIANQYDKPLLFSGPVIPDPSTSPLEERWDKWLGGFQAGSVVYCSFGSECVLKKDQFQELLLGFELMGLPFFVALKPPQGAETIEAAMPEGLKERVKGRGVVCGEWVQQQLILEHPSVGCFVSHCGAGSIWESLMNGCQMVLLPHSCDQFLQARLMSEDLKVGVEIERGEEDGLITRESVCKVIKLVMDEESQVGREVRANLAKLRETLLSEAFDSSYVDSFIKNLQDLCSS